MTTSSSTSSSTSSTTSSSTSASLSMNSLANISSFVSVKLNNENYLSWKHQMVTILKTLGLLKFINPHNSPPPANSPESENFERLDGYVSACINATLDPTIAHLAINTTSAAQLWKMIEDTYFQNAFAKKSQLHTQFQTIKQGNNSIASFCDSIKHIFDSLNSIGETVSKTALVMQTIHGLNSSYNAFVLNVENSSTVLTFAQLRSRLLIFEERLAQITEPLSPISAMQATVKESETRDSAPHRDQGNSNRNPKLTCQICQKEGHDASKCYWRYTPSNQNPNFGSRSSSRGGRGGGRFGSRGGRGGVRNNFRGVPHGYGGNFVANFAQQRSYGGPPFSSMQVPGGGGLPFTGNGYQVGPQFGCFNGFHAGGYSKVGPNNMQYTNGPNYTHDTSNSNGFNQTDFNQWASQQNETESAGSQFGLTAETKPSINFSDVCQMVDTWIPDSGATAHMTANPSIVSDAKPYTGSDRVIVGDDSYRNNRQRVYPVWIRLHVVEC